MTAPMPPPMADAADDQDARSSALSGREVAERRGDGDRHADHADGCRGGW